MMKFWRRAGALMCERVRVRERAGERGGMRMASLSNRLCRFSSVCNCQCMCLFLCVCPVHVCVDVNM